MPRGKDGKAQEARRKHYEGPFPEPGPFKHLYDYLCESGPLTTWQELKSWQEVTSITLEPWESKILWRVSCAYMEQIGKSTDPNCPPPWVDEDQIDRKAVADKTRSLFRMLGRKK